MRKTIISLWVILAFILLPAIFSEDLPDAGTVITFTFSQVSANGVNVWSPEDNPDLRPFAPPEIAGTVLEVIYQASFNENFSNNRLQQYFDEKKAKDSSTSLWSVNNQFQIRSRSQSDIQNAVDQINAKYDQLLDVLLKIDSKRQQIATYLTEVQSGQHQDKAHTPLMDELIDLKREQARIEGEITSLKNTASTMTGSGPLGWFVEIPEEAW